MEIFGIGVLEVMAVMLLMAIVFGPHRLPEIAKQAGRAVRELREYARDFRDEYLTDFEEVREEYLEVRYELEQTDSEFRQEMKELDEDLRSTVREAEKDATEAVKEAESAVKDTETAVRDNDQSATKSSASTATKAKPAAPTRPAAVVGEANDEDNDNAAGGEASRARRLGRGRRRETKRGAARGENVGRPGKVISINRRRPPQK